MLGLGLVKSVQTACVERVRVRARVRARVNDLVRVRVRVSKICPSSLH